MPVAGAKITIDRRPRIAPHLAGIREAEYIHAARRCFRVHCPPQFNREQQSVIAVKAIEVVTANILPSPKPRQVIKRNLAAALWFFEFAFRTQRQGGAWISKRNVAANIKLALDPT